MTWAENLFSNLLTVFILTAVFIVIYLKVKGITFIEFFRGLKEVFFGTAEQAYETTQGGFQDIV